MNDNDIDWFGVGWAVFKGSTIPSDFLPPVNDEQAQVEWLDGFQTAWVEYPTYDDNTSSPVLLELERKLVEHQKLLDQLKNVLASAARHGERNEGA